MTSTSIKKIKVAILAEEPIGWGSGKHFFPAILQGYSWQGKKQRYVIETSYVFDKDIYENKLNSSQYDVLLVPGGGVGDGECIAKGLTFLPKVRTWKKHIQSFIKDGGGYIGICGGTALLTNLKTANKKSTIMEKLYDKSSLKVSVVKSYYKEMALPIFYLFQRQSPEKIGPLAYVFSFQPGKTVDNQKIVAGGIPITCTINNRHDFFTGFSKNHITLRWWGGPGLFVPKNTDREVSILARYPSVDFSTEAKTKLNAWMYTGGIVGLLRGLKKAAFYIKKHNKSFKELLTYAFYFAGDWEKTEKIIDLDLANRPCITTEIYPNDNKARIFLCATHPEYMIWKDGRIKEVEDNDFNCIGSGFHRWESIKDFSPDGLRELTHSWWVIRRAVAWAAKIPSEDYPPIYETEDKMILKELKNDVFWDGTIDHQMAKI